MRYRDGRFGGTKAPIRSVFSPADCHVCPPVIGYVIDSICIPISRNALPLSAPERGLGVRCPLSVSERGAGLRSTFAFGRLDDGEDNIGPVSTHQKQGIVDVGFGRIPLS